MAKKEKAKLQLNIESIDTTISFPQISIEGLSENMDNYNKDLTAKLNVAVDKIRDIIVWMNDSGLSIHSNGRNITIFIRDYGILKHVNEKVANERIETVIRLMQEADKKYEPKSSDDVETDMYYYLMKGAVNKETKHKTLLESIEEKRSAKKQAKKDVRNKWFKIGSEYILKKTDLNGEVISEDRYRCVKYVYTVGKNPVNCVVMKRLNDSYGDAKCLGVMDCRILHIKYDKNLYMFPMNQRFYPVKENSDTKK